MNLTRFTDRWYESGRPPFTLRAAATLYGIVARIRRGLYACDIAGRIKLAVPVVVVGNVTAGGTGKTPLTLWLADALAGCGYRPGIVCRSYAAQARVSGPVAPTDDPALWGDEAVLIATRSDCPVWSGPGRAQTARAMTAARPEIDVVVCDDGLQHYALHRDVEIAVIDAARAFGNGYLLPAGPLREPVARLTRVDAIVLQGDGNDVPDLPQHVACFRMRLVGDRFEQLGHAGRVREACDFAGSRLTALAGIGNPERFFDHLRNLGLEFTARIFPDHHRYTPAEIASLDADCVLMTQKDAIKCAQFPDERMWMLPVRAEVDAMLLRLLVGSIEAARRAQHLTPQ